MAHLSGADIARLASSVGWRGDDLMRAVATALAESSGDTNARNTARGNDARGIWQINVGPRANPQYKSLNLYDPNVNAKIAHDMWSRQGWKPWAESRAHQILRTPEARLAIARMGLNDAGQSVTDATEAAGDAATSVSEGLGNVSEAIAKAAAWLSTPANWLRIAYVVAGISVVIGGSVVLARPAIDSTLDTISKAKIV